ncbi:MAG TPA: biotin--[acetyl-CoA-carboxylase] ligase [Candidatus Udaeobacter sp.]|jgi:BirA family biotin operon repressor/biotin-[acetyl-CoA-carboxylase] ligase
MFQAESVDRLIADELQAHFACATIGRQIIVLEQTGSTNDAILQVATGNTKEGLVLFAEHQTAARGQRGNRWESVAAKGLWFSILLRPEIQINDSAQLTIWAIEAISDVIRTELSLQPAIKLPNDIQVHGRKVAGVLVEMRAQEKAPHLAIVGIGINVNQSLQDFPRELQNRAISLAMVLQQPVDRQKFAVALLRNLDRTYQARFAPKG